MQRAVPAPDRCCAAVRSPRSVVDSCRKQQAGEAVSSPLPFSGRFSAHGGDCDARVGQVHTR